jgi:hypothetical protein
MYGIWSLYVPHKTMSGESDLVNRTNAVQSRRLQVRAYASQSKVSQVSAGVKILDETSGVCWHGNERGA